MIGVVTAAVFVILVTLIIMLIFGYLLISYRKAVTQSKKDYLYTYMHTKVYYGVLCIYDILFFYQDNNSANSLDLKPNVAYVTTDFNVAKATPVYEEIDFTVDDAGSITQEYIETTFYDN